MLRPVKTICFRCSPPKRIVFGTNGCGEISSMIGWRASTISTSPTSSAISGRTQLLASATCARLKTQSAVARALMAVRNCS